MYQNRAQMWTKYLWITHATYISTLLLENPWSPHPPSLPLNLTNHYLIDVKKNRFSWTDWERILGFYSQEWHRVSFRKNWILDLKNNMFQDEILWERTAFTKWLPMFMGLSLIRIEPCIARSRQLTTRLLLGWNKVYECRVYRIFADFTCRMKISFQCGCGVLSCIVFIVTQDPKFCTKPDQPGNALKLYLFSICQWFEKQSRNARNTMVIHGQGSNSILLRLLHQLTIRNEK